MSGGRAEQSLGGTEVLALPALTGHQGSCFPAQGAVNEREGRNVFPARPLTGQVPVVTSMDIVPIILPLLTAQFSLWV